MAKSKKEKDQQRAFKGIWITAEVWLSAELTMQEKLFLVEIESLDNKDGCYATNQYFSDFFGISKVRVSEVISSLIFKGFLVSDINKSEGNERTLRVVKSRMQALKENFDSLENKSLRGSQTKLKEGIKQTFTSNNNPASNPSSNPLSKDSVVTDTPPLATNLSSAEIPTGSESLESRANNLKGTIIENHFYESENLVSLKEKSRTEKVNSGGGGENSQSDVGKLDIDAKISPLGMSAEKLDFIFLEASRIDTTEIRAKFIDWHVRRAKETNGVRTCAIYAKKMRLMANSDLEVWEVIKGLEIAYEAAWIDIQPDWIKKRTRQNDKQNGTTKLQQQKQYIADSPLFKGI